MGAIWRLRYKCIKREPLYLSAHPPSEVPASPLLADEWAFLLYDFRDSGNHFTSPSPYTHSTYLPLYIKSDVHLIVYAYFFSLKLKNNV